IPEGPTTQTITSASDQRKSVPVVTVESFFNTHGEKLALRLEGPRVGFHRKIREPTINRPGLALSGFFVYFAEKRVQVLGAAENTYLKSLSPKLRVKRFRALCEQKIPCVVISRGAHLDDPMMAVAADEEIAIFRTPMITMKFINAATIDFQRDSSGIDKFHDEIYQCRYYRAGSRFFSDGDRIRQHGRHSWRRRSHSRCKRHRQKRERAAIDRTRIQLGGGRRDSDHFVGGARIDGDGAGPDALSHGSARDRDN